MEANMNYSKLCICGDKKILITANTNVKIIPATRIEINRYKNSRLKIKEKLWNKDEILSQLVDILNDFKDPKGDFGNSTGVKSAILRAFDIDLKLNDCYNVACELYYCGTFRIKYTYMNRFVKWRDAREIEIESSANYIIKLFSVLHNELIKEKSKKNILGQQKKLTGNYKKLNDFFIQKNSEIRSLLSIEKANAKVKDHDLLVVDNNIFLEDYCGFDIFQKEREIKTIIKKILDSNDPGEKEVAYAIKWLKSDSNLSFIEIKKNCESKYRYGCILLKKPDFIDEPQEYDHILVCDSGVILIETKHWKGQVEIRPDGKWIRDSENNGKIIGEKNPVSQMKRHEMLMKSILPNVPVYSILCFSNSSLIIKGAENCKDYPISYIDQLEDVIIQLINSRKAPNGDVDYIVNEIEKHKINVVEEVCEI